MMKKSFFIAIFVLIMGSAFTLGGKSKKSGEKTLIGQGLSLISLMNEKAGNENYVSLLYGGSDELSSLIKEIKIPDNMEDFKAYKISGEFSAFLNAMLSGMGGSFDTGSFSPQIKKDMNQRLLTGFASMWNGKTAGTTALAAASILQSEKVFVSKELKEDCIYIFTFKDSYPVAVSFIQGEDNAVKAEACYIFYKDFVKSFKEFCSEMELGMELEEIK